MYLFISNDLFLFLHFGQLIQVEMIYFVDFADLY